MRNIVLVFVLAGCASWSGTAWAGSPFVTDDPGFVGKGHWEIKLVDISEHHAKYDIYQKPLDINYSIIDHLKLNLTLGEKTLINENGTAYAGLSDIDLKFKYRFLDEKEKSWRPAISFAPNITIPTADKNRGLGDGVYRLRLPFQFGKTVGKWDVFAETGYQISMAPNVSDNAIYGLGAKYNFTERFSTGLELNGSTPVDTPSQHNMLANMGMIYVLNKKLQVQWSAGRTVRPDKFDGPKIIGQFFIQLNF